MRYIALFLIMAVTACKQRHNPEYAFGIMRQDSACNITWSMYDSVNKKWIPIGKDTIKTSINN